VGGGVIAIHPVELPGTTGHVIVEIPKIVHSDRRYPRSATVTKGKSLAEVQ